MSKQKVNRTNQNKSIKIVNDTSICFSLNCQLWARGRKKW